MEFILRAAADNDYPWLWELKRLTMKPYVEETWGTWDDAAQEAFFRENFRSDTTLQIVILDGCNAGLLHIEREPDELFLANIQIHPDFQHRGLGTAVIRTVLETGRMLQLPIRLQVLKVNAAARSLYLRLGFVAVKETLTHVVMRWQPERRA